MLTAFMNLFGTSQGNAQDQSQNKTSDRQMSTDSSNETLAPLTVRSKKADATQPNGSVDSIDSIDARSQPLKLLDLPYDCLKIILDKLGTTYDFIQLALTCKALHKLAVPEIYESFDIEWPDPNLESEEACSRGVDALTYGLATLVMSEDVFARPNDDPSARTAAVRRGNLYAQHCRKFVLANGPWEQVKEYRISEARGKMLGTLVALAIGRMPNLNEFSWDMPTGVVPDVWTALSSLADQNDGQCKLESFRFRLHDHIDMRKSCQSKKNQDCSGIKEALLQRPNFSLVPPVHLLAVLDIDHIEYLDEISVLLAKSRSKLHTLILSLSRRALREDWVRGESKSRSGEPILDLQRKFHAKAPRIHRVGGAIGSLFSQLVRPTDAAEGSHPSNESQSSVQIRGCDPFVTWTWPAVSHGEGVSRLSSPVRTGLSLPTVGPVSTKSSMDPNNSSQSTSGHDNPPKYWEVKRLELSTLRLQRVPLALEALAIAVRWESIVRLTLIDCDSANHLWESFRHEFISTKSHKGCTSESHASVPNVPNFFLSLKEVHINQVSVATIETLTKALAPNSLQRLFLQDSPRDLSSITPDKIIKGPVRRHRESLKELAIDSSWLASFDGRETSWIKWIVGRESLRFLLSGKLTKIRELCFCMYYRDWNFVLQSLPNMPQLQALYIPKLSRAARADEIDESELAAQVLNIVVIRPEIQLKYLAIGEKCWMLTECDEDQGVQGQSVADDAVSSDEEDMHGNHDDNDETAVLVVDEEEEGEADDDEDAQEQSHDDDDDSLSESDGSGWSSNEDEPRQHIKLSPIQLWSVQTVAIFKARHIEL